jgi:polyisoprenoid-binding protein YceI
MKPAVLLLASFLVLFPSCRESATDTGTPAQVTETTSTSSTTLTDSAAIGTSTAPAPGATVANVIKEKSAIRFVGAKVTRDHNGEFKKFDGNIEYMAGKPSRITFDIDLNSIETDTPKLTDHLKSPDFFDVAKNPKATFVSSALTDAPAGSPAGATHIVRGNLTMHGVTREVTFPVKAEMTPAGVHATSEFSINRHDWGISYKGVADDLIKDNVLIKLDLAFPPAPAA